MAAATSREMSALLAKTSRMSLRANAGGQRGMSSSRAVLEPETSSSASTSTSATRPSTASLLNDPSPLSAAPAASSSSDSSRSSTIPAFRSGPLAAQRSPPFGRSSIEPLRHAARYRLHAHCGKHNTLLSLTKDTQMINSSSPRAALHAGEQGIGFSNDTSLEEKERDAKQYGQTVGRVSCGSVGFRKAQRATFEAATRCSARIFEIIEQLGSVGSSRWTCAQADCTIFSLQDKRQKDKERDSDTGCQSRTYRIGPQGLWTRTRGAHSCIVHNGWRDHKETYQASHGRDTHQDRRSKAEEAQKAGPAAGSVEAAAVVHGRYLQTRSLVFVEKSRSSSMSQLGRYSSGVCIQSRFVSHVYSVATGCLTARLSSDSLCQTRTTFATTSTSRLLSVRRIFLASAPSGRAHPPYHPNFRTNAAAAYRNMSSNVSAAVAAFREVEGSQTKKLENVRCSLPAAAATAVERTRAIDLIDLISPSRYNRLRSETF